MQKFWSFHSRKFSVLAEEASALLQKNRNYTFRTVSRYRGSWRKIEQFMAARDIVDYSPAVEQAYIKEKYGGRPYHALPIRDKGHVGRIKVLTEFVLTGEINPLFLDGKLIAKKYWPFKAKSFSVLAEEASSLLKRNCTLEFRTVGRYRTSWRAIERFMGKKGIDSYSPAVEQGYIKDRYGQRAYHELPAKEKAHIGRIKVLTEFQETGNIRPRVVEEKGTAGVQHACPL